MKIAGKITDETGQGLPGANISMEAYPSINTMTDADGKFSLENEKLTNISPVKITYLGYKPKFIIASKLVGKTIAMEEDFIALDDAVVINDYKPKTPSSLPASNKLVNHLKKNATPYTVALSLLIIFAGVYAIKKVQ